ncbi:MAG: methyltransferase domain-containing protein [Bryobacteraceae bacterium]|jgi:SAM-dependent methyltransferase
MVTHPQSSWIWKQRQIRTFLAILLLGALGGGIPARAFQERHPLTGRRIAPVMGAAGADWLDRSERDAEEKPEVGLDSLGLKPGMIVADVGAGSGYMSLRMAVRVGPTGKVLAEDVQPEMLRLLKQNQATARLTNIETVLGTETDPKLPEGKLDLILMVDVYHELSQPQKMLRKLREALKPDGRLVLFEYRKEDPSIPIKPEHKMSVQEAKTEVEAEGFHLSNVIETLPRQHILVFTRQQ